MKNTRLTTTPSPHPCTPCVIFERPRVCRQNARMCFNMCAWCRHTRGRFECTHGGRFVHRHTGFFTFFQRAATNTHTHQTHTATINNTTTTTAHTAQHHNTQHHTETETERERQKQKQRKRDRERETRQDKNREDETRKEKKREDERGRDEKDKRR